MLKQILHHIHPIQEDILDAYLSHWKEGQYKRKEFITMEGEIEKYLYFTLEGVQKSYFIRNNKEYIMAFAHPGSFSGNPRSLFSQKPSEVFIECITPCKLLKIKYATHLELLQKHRELETLFRIATEHLLVGIIDRYSDLMSLTIEERFVAFAKRSPKLLNIIPHKDLASYLRIDSTNFSKLINSVRL